MRTAYLGARTRRSLSILAALAATAAFAAPASAVVIPGDAFTFAIAGFNTTSGVGYILGSGLIGVFGTTQTYTGAGYNGQNYTITSSEVVGATTTTDFFRLSTPTNFLTSTTINGTTINALQFSIGDVNSGAGVATGANPVNFLTPVTSYTATGNIVYGTANTTFTFPPNVTLGTGGLSFTMTEGVNTGTSAISTFAVHDFNFSITYANAVPEPATWAMLIGGFGIVGAMLRRRAAGTLRTA